MGNSSFKNLVVMIEEAWDQRNKKDSWVYINHNEENTLLDDVPRKEEKSNFRLLEESRQLKIDQSLLNK